MMVYEDGVAPAGMLSHSALCSGNFCPAAKGKKCIKHTGRRNAWLRKRHGRNALFRRLGRRNTLEESVNGLFCRCERRKALDRSEMV